MRRSIPHVQNALTLLSLLLFVGTASLWKRSYLHQDQFTLEDQFNWTLIKSNRGAITIEREHEFIRQLSGPWTTPWTYIPIDVTAWDNDNLESRKVDWRSTLLGWNWAYGTDWTSTTSTWWISKVPYWMLVVVFAVLPVRSLIGLRGRAMRRKRIATGLCGKCGYDMRFTPAQCPECGSTTASEADWTRARQLGFPGLLLTGALASLPVAIAIVCFLHFQLFRTAEAKSERRTEARASGVSTLSDFLAGFRTREYHDMSPACQSYVARSLTGAIHQLQTNPEMDHPWLASAAICLVYDGYIEFEYAYFDGPEQVEGFVLLDGDRVLGKYFNFAISDGIVYSSYGTHRVTLVDAYSPPNGRVKPSRLKLPRSELSHRLSIKLLRRKLPDSDSIPVFIDPVLQREPATKAAG